MTSERRPAAHRYAKGYEAISKPFKAHHSAVTAVYKCVHGKKFTPNQQFKQIRMLRYCDGILNELKHQRTEAMLYRRGGQNVSQMMREADNLLQKAFTWRYRCWITGEGHTVPISAPIHQKVNFPCLWLYFTAGGPGHGFQFSLSPFMTLSLKRASFSVFTVKKRNWKNRV